MSQIITKLNSKSTIWLLKKRYRVGEPATHNGTNWINETGHNSEPGAGSDWKDIGSTSGGVFQEFDSTPGQTEYTVTEGTINDKYRLVIEGSTQIKAYSSRVGQVVTTPAQNEGVIVQIIN